MSSVMRTWTAERPSFGLGIALLGSAIVALGLFGLEWDVHADWFAVRHVIGYSGDANSVLSQAYSRVLYLPIFVCALVSAFSATAGRLIARVGSALAGVALGGWLIGVFIWVETGAVGTGSSRHDALPAFVVITIVGVGCLVLGAGALFDDTAVLARSLAAAAAVLAVVVHVYVIEDVLAEPSIGAWAPAVGYALLALAPALPYRRIERTG
ncbi:MAG: hypothetical protein QOH89_522 [Pseudonocardiales bacterium]|nr:hypothetical protein [Pseudonocardiales bacterium]